MPNRIIRESILSSEKVAALGWPEEVFYRRLHSIVDDYGRTEANPQLLRSRCYPLQTDNVRTADITRWMAACQKAGLILGYEVNGKQYLEVTNFGQQQRSASKFPAPPASDSNCYQVLADAHLDVSVFVSEDVVDKSTRKRLPTPDGVSDAIWEAFLKVRKAKRAPMSELALDGIRREAAAAGWTLEAALSECVTRGWQAFKADWVAERKVSTFAQQAADIARTTVPSKPGRDPALLRIEEDAKKAAPIPENIREKLAALKGGVLQ